ncbi:MAG: putative nucleotidyltransferase [bacterium]|jgi:predicted nucleotidyltransferase
MTTSNQSYKDLSIPHFKEVFDIIDGALQEHNIPYYLIGATAIALELLKDGIKPSRGTKDIDFAIMISSLHQYDNLGDTLVTKGFNRVKAPWTFYSEEYNVAIDILPFGEIEEQDTIQFNKRYSDLHVLGMKEVLEETEEVIIDKKIVNIPPLPGMIVLKLVAWSYRPEERENDLADILRIIEHYFDLNFDEIMEFHNDIFSDEEFDETLISAEVLGRKSREILQKYKELELRILNVLDTNLKSDQESIIAKDWAVKKGWQIQYALKVLKALQKAILDT